MRARRLRRVRGLREALNGSLVVAALGAAALAAPAQAATPKIFHDSFSSAYRSPGGAVPTGSRVTLRVRGVGAKAAWLHVAPSRLIKMCRRGSTWSAVLRTPRTPTILHYAFRLKVGKRIVWYGDDYGGADDDLHQGGTGAASPFRPVRFAAAREGRVPSDSERGN